MNPLRCGPDGCVALDARVLVGGVGSVTEVSLPPTTGVGVSTPARQGRAGLLLPLLGLMYASACGGPYGTEDYVAKVGPGLFLLLLVTPVDLGIAHRLRHRRAVHAAVGGGRPLPLGLRVPRALLGFPGRRLEPPCRPSSTTPSTPSSSPGRSPTSWGVSPLVEWAMAAAFILILTYLNYRGIQIAGTAASP